MDITHVPGGHGEHTVPAGSNELARRNARHESRDRIAVLPVSYGQLEREAWHMGITKAGLVVTLACLISASCSAQDSCAEQRFVLDRMTPAEAFVDPAQYRLVVAALCNDETEVEKALTSGADIDVPGSNGVTPLVWAITSNNYDAVRLLLDNGADPNRFINFSKYKNDIYPITYAAIYSDYSINELMIKRGAKINPWNKGESPLMDVVSRGKIDVVRLFLENGADPNYMQGGIISVGIVLTGDPKSLEILNILLDNGYCKTLEKIYGGFVRDKERLIFVSEAHYDLMLKTIERLKNVIDEDGEC